MFLATHSLPSALDLVKLNLFQFDPLTVLAFALGSAMSVVHLFKILPISGHYDEHPE